MGLSEIYRGEAGSGVEESQQGCICDRGSMKSPWGTP